MKLHRPTAVPSIQHLDGTAAVSLRKSLGLLFHRAPAGDSPLKYGRRLRSTEAARPDPEPGPRGVCTGYFRRGCLLALFQPEKSSRAYGASICYISRSFLAKADRDIQNDVAF